MTEPRITWSYDAGLYLWSGSVGTIGPMFRIVAPLIEGRGFLLASSFPGQERKRRDSVDLNELKAEAERWLEEFTSSLGAVFPELRRQRDIADRIDQIIGWAKDGAGHDWYRMDREKVDRMRDDILSYAFGTPAPSAPRTEG